MNRGDIVSVVLSREYGKPRPALIIQNDAVAAFDSVLLCPLTSDVVGADTVRVRVHPTPENGLTRPSEIMTEKLTAVPLSRIGDRIGALDRATLRDVEARLVFLLGLG